MIQTKRWYRSLRCVFAQALLVVAVLACAGCVNTQTLGDRAFKSEEYGLALDYYEQAIAEGVRDPQLYVRAAKAATAQGAFPQAERYYSQALRHGGGVEVARALAQLYVQTNNFAQAVRVYQYLMRVEKDVQPVYSNMGAALMYSGRYLDAESFMIIAQQMNPADPVPYINLGVLYDRHIRNRPRAAAFYGCFTELTSDASQRRLVQNRLMEMGNEGPIDGSRVGLECGEVFRLPEPVAVDLSDALKDYGGEVDLGFEVEPGQTSEEIEVQRMVASEDEQDTSESDSPVASNEAAEDAQEGVSEQEQQPADGTSEAPTVEVDVDVVAPAESDGVSRAEAEAAGYFEDGRYDDVVRTLRGLEERSEAGDRQLGLALYRTGRFEDAIGWLELSLERLPSPQVAGALLDAYGRQGNRDAMGPVCERFQGWPDYEAVLERCPKAGAGAANGE